MKTVISGNTVDIQLADAPVFAGKLTANGLDAMVRKLPMLVRAYIAFL
ncbi:hypothetical protein IDM32_15900 [Acinetobacter seifertii]|nr:hypothetical protein [Acinetobacter seifertii]